MDRDDDDFGEGFIAESHPLRPTGLSVPGRDSRAPSISSSITDMDVPIYTRETTIPYPKAVNTKFNFFISKHKVNMKILLFKKELVFVQIVDYFL